MSGLVGADTMQDAGGSQRDHPIAIDPEYARITTPAPFDLFWNYRRRTPTPLNWLRAARAAVVWRARPGLRATHVYLRLGGWIVRFPFDVVRFMLLYGAIWKRTFGRSHVQQVIDMSVIAAANALMPRDYYKCDIARRRRSSGFFDVVPYQLFASPVSVFSAQNGGASLAKINNKWETGQYLKSRGIPVPKAFALIQGADFIGPDGDAPTLPQADLLVKPAAAFQGQNISIWRFEHNAKRWTKGSERCDAQGLQAELMRSSVDMPGGAIVMEVLENHPNMKPFAPYALSTFRVVTMIDEAGMPAVVICQFRTAVDPESAVDNFHAGGCLFFVDVTRGQFGEGQRGSYSFEPISLQEHPANGTRLTGVAVPGLDAVCKLAVQAHQQFSELPCIGWDIAQTTKGVVVIEANVPPGLQPTQQVSMGGFVHTRYMELLGHHSKKWIETNEPVHSRFRVGADRAKRGCTGK